MEERRWASLLRRECTCHGGPHGRAASQGWLPTHSFLSPEIDQIDAFPITSSIFKTLTEAMPGIAHQWIMGKQKRVFHSANAVR